MVSNTKELSEAVNAAKEAVRDLEEPLRTEAFKILLDKLISGGGTKTGRQNGGGKNFRIKSRASANNSKRSAAPVAASTLKLEVNELRKLKTYCERFELGGTEQIAFILANFIREHTNLQCITATDIAYLYRQLVSQRIKILAVNDVADWTRALHWLSAPSRKKEWLERSGEGYVVSNSGLLRFHELESQAKPNQSN